MLSHTRSGLAPSRSMARMHGAEAPKVPLPCESAESESLQKLFANIRGQIGFRVCTCDVRNRLAYACVYRVCQKGMGVARMGPAEHRCHARDLSALVDLVGHGCEQVGTGRKQRVKVGHHAVLPDEGMRPVETRVQGASHHLAPVVDAGGYSAKLACAVSAADYPNNLAVVVNALGNRASSEVRKRGGRAVFPQYGANNRLGAVLRVAYGLALIVDRECESVWIATQRTKRLDFAFFP